MHSSKMFITPSTTFRSFSFFPPLPPRLTPPSLVSRNTNKNKFQKLCKSSTTAERSGEIAQSRLRQMRKYHVEPKPGSTRPHVLIRVSIAARTRRSRNVLFLLLNLQAARSGRHMYRTWEQECVCALIPGYYLDWKEQRSFGGFPR